MESNIDEIQKEVDQLCQEAEYDYTQDRSSKFRERISKVIQKIENTLNDDQLLPKANKVKLFVSKGKAYDILPEYSKQAEESLTKAMKLSPQDPDCLVTLGHILWKKKDLNGACQCFESAVEADPQNIKALQFLSIALRQMGEGILRSENISKSVDIAKKALMLDMKNSQSWYLVGNAYVSDYFANHKIQLDLALKAYNQAQIYATQENPDLYFNRGNVLCYFEDYDRAFLDYRKAISIDPSLASDKIKEEEKKILQVKNMIDSKCHIAAKKIQNIIKQIPTGLKKQPFTNGKEYKMQPLNELKEGKNLGQILACKSLKAYTQQNTIPAGFLIIDSNGAMAALSIYHCSEDIYQKISDNTDIYVVDPILKNINVTVQDQMIQYICVQIQEINKLYVQEQQITGAFAPSIAVNKTFEK